MGAADQAIGLGEFLSSYRASIVVLNGAAHGTEVALDQLRTTLGRGPGADLCFDDLEMSREHVSIEFELGCFRIQKLAVDRVLLVNGGETVSAELKSEDRFQLGHHSFEFLLEERRHQGLPQ